jgi:hypothetical protein
MLPKSNEDLYSFESLRSIKEFDPLSKLRQSYRLSDIERQHLAEILSNAGDDVKRLDKEIARLSGLLFSLRKAREEIVAASNLAKSMLSPIQKLPPEILNCIFKLCDTKIYLTARRTRSPINALVSVCSSWREQVLSNRSLWSTFDVKLGSGELSRSNVQLFKELLDRSADGPLDIRVKVSMEYSASVSCGRIFRILQGVSNRLHHFTLDCHPKYHQECFGIISHLPELKTLYLSTDANFAGDTPLLRVVAPQLHSVTFLNRAADHYQFSYDLPWSQLSTLSLGPGKLAYFWDALSKCTTLTNAELRFCHNDMITSAPDTILSSNLSSLTLEGINADKHSSTCFDALSLPSLRKFTLKAVPYHMPYGLPGFWVKFDVFPVTAFAALLHRSNCSLTSLHLRSVLFTEEGLISTLQIDKLDTLTDLVVTEPQRSSCAWYEEYPEYEDWEDTDYPDRKNSKGFNTCCVTTGLLEKLTIGFDSDTGSSLSFFQRPFLPNLQRLTLKGKGYREKLSFQKFQDMVKSRWRDPELRYHSSVACLKCVKLRVWERDFSSEELGPGTDLDLLRSWGMTIDVESGGDESEEDESEEDESGEDESVSEDD